MAQPSPVMPGPIPTYPKASQKTRWKLILGLIVCLVLVCTAFVLGILSLTMSVIKGSTVAKEAMARVRSNPVVVQKIGTPIEIGWVVRGSISISGPSGNADLALPVSGPNGKGTVYVTAKKSGGVWGYSLMQVAIVGSPRRIDLLEQPTDEPGFPH